jgi:hypothetical protein
MLLSLSNSAKGFVGRSGVFLIEGQPALRVIGRAECQPIGSALGVILGDRVAADAITVSRRSRETVGPRKSNRTIDWMMGAPAYQDTDYHYKCSTHNHTLSKGCGSPIAQRKGVE